MWRRDFLLFFIVILVFSMISCARNEKQVKPKGKEVVKEESVTAVIQLTSSAFKEGELIPSKYTCDGEDISPPLSWSNVPKGTKSLALICDDPDAPIGTWIHWVVYNIPPTVNQLPEGIPATEAIPNGAKQGISDFKRLGYGGPCPPSGTHRYFFKLYALDTQLQLKSEATKEDLVGAMEGHTLGTGQLIGKYKRK